MHSVKRVGLSLAVLVSIVACHNPNTSEGTGRASARQAVDSFMGAVKAQNLQAMSDVWGNEKGPARDRMDRNELEKRELLMQCYLKHDSYKVLGESGSRADQRVFTIRLVRGRVTRDLTIETVKASSNQWYVFAADLSKVQDMCTDMARQ